MRDSKPFGPYDLAELDDRLLARAARVVAMEDVAMGDRREPNVIGLRHDCDAGHSLETAVKMAHWEAERGYRSTYFLLHTSPYWNYERFEEAVAEIAAFGHEIGIHSDALAESFRTGEDPDLILDRAITRLRGFGYRVRGVVGHGNPICIRLRQPDESPFANDEQFAECRRYKHGDANRILVRGNVSRKLEPRSLADFGLEYEALWCAHPWSWRCSDSGGQWLNPGFDETADKFSRQTDVSTLPSETDDPRQLHLLIHPDWWMHAFASLGTPA